MSDVVKRGYPFPSREFIAKTMATVSAEVVANASNAEHPEDIASAMVIALDAVAATLKYLHEQDCLLERVYKS